MLESNRGICVFAVTHTVTMEWATPLYVTIPARVTSILPVVGSSTTRSLPPQRLSKDTPSIQSVSRDTIFFHFGMFFLTPVILYGMHLLLGDLIFFGKSTP